MMENGERLFREHHQQLIALADAIKEQAEYLAYSVNPIGMPYEQWRMIIENSQADIAEIEKLLPRLKAVFAECLET